jgi:hypothetical protein
MTYARRTMTIPMIACVKALVPFFIPVSFPCEIIMRNPPYMATAIPKTATSCNMIPMAFPAKPVRSDGVLVGVGHPALLGRVLQVSNFILVISFASAYTNTAVLRHRSKTIPLMMFSIFIFFCIVILLSSL